MLAFVLAAAVAGVPVHFAPRVGWHAGATRMHACPGVLASRCQSATAWAATTRWRDCADCLPHRTLAALGANGIAVQIRAGVEHPLAVRARLTWPPRVRRDEVHAGFEGVPADIGVYQRFGRVGRGEVYVWVFFGRKSPTARQLRRANRELAAARLAL